MPDTGVIGAAEFGQHGVGSRLEPFDQTFEILKLHRGAAGGAIMITAADMKENFIPGGRIGIVVIMFDEDQPLVGGIAKMEFFLVPPRRIRRAGRERIEMVVTKAGQGGIVDPGIAFGDLVVGPAFCAIG